VLMCGLSNVTVPLTYNYTLPIIPVKNHPGSVSLTVNLTYNN